MPSPDLVRNAALRLSHHLPGMKLLRAAGLFVLKAMPKEKSLWNEQPWDH